MVQFHPVIDRSDSSLELIPASGTENRERDQSSIVEPLILFPLSAGDVKGDRKRDECYAPASLGPFITLGGHRADEYRQLDPSANNIVWQSAHEELRSPFPLAPGGTRANRERDWNTIAAEDHVPKSPGPINTGAHHIAPGEGANSRKRVREILSEEDHPLSLPRLSDSNDDGYHQDLSAEDREQPAPDFPSPSLPNLTTRLDKDGLNSPNHEETAGPVSRNDLQKAGPTDLMAKRPLLSDSEKTVVWKPPRISDEAKLAAHFMAIHFDRALANTPSRFQLAKLHRVHHILIPFAYRLLMKPLNVEIWARILVVWRNLWYEEKKIVSATATRKRSADEVLKKFLWISNFICESTRPELFRGASTKHLGAFRLTEAETRIMEKLSDGRTASPKVLDSKRSLAIQDVKHMMFAELGVGNRNSQVKSESDRLMRKWVLDVMKAQADPMAPTSAEVEKVGPTSDLFDDETWTKLRLNYPCLYQYNMPPELKPNIRKLFQRLKFDHETDS
ncbi:hypothetical protein PTTG_29841 [Puccinia triticina 1-1 BBBD Race 1]|uniref:Uncharacterized protein n=1 Tax=Puccinia triticina (isolate 1-1 / race 1 (BBBD)) TaxID=630390 RepID=A0A180G291_PUCT1|nr:hypothetical protein PTTG_29841 [Puccinia triticina 1-1 BBBD Race 1]